MRRTSSVGILLICTALLGCQEARRQEYREVHTALSESPSAGKLFVGECVNDPRMKELAKDPYVRNLLAVPKDQALQVLCERIIRGFAKGTITEDDFVTRDRIPQNFTNVIRGRI